VVIIDVCRHQLSAAHATVISVLTAHLLLWRGLFNSRPFSTDIIHSMELCTGCHLFDSLQYTSGFIAKVWLVQLIVLTITNLYDQWMPEHYLL